MPEPLAPAEIQTLAAIFHQPASAQQLLEAAGIPRHRQPAWPATAEEYWREVNASLAAGIVADGRLRILAAAAKMYPANPVLAGFAGEPEVPPHSAKGKASTVGTPGGPPGTAGRYQVDARGARGLAVGDGISQTNVFTD